MKRLLAACGFATAMALAPLGACGGGGGNGAAGPGGGGEPPPSGEVKLWDTLEHYQGFWDAFANSFANRDQWSRVPSGTTAHAFAGDTVIENEYFYLSFNANSQDDLHVKKGNDTLWRNIFYRCYYPGTIEVGGTKVYDGETRSIRILSNTAGEVTVEHEGSDYPIVTTYRVPAGKPWVEVRPVSQAHMLGIHGKVRMGLAPVEGGNDYVVDSLRDPKGLYVPPQGKVVIDFFESVNSAFMWVLAFPSFERANTYFNNDSGPTGDTMWSDGGTRGGLTLPRSWNGCITATYSRFGNQTEPVLVGALAYWDNWYREHPDRAIAAGETYRSTWRPPYPGRWRMTARIAERRYDQGFAYDGVTEFPAAYFSKDVTDGDFSFTAPAAGWLDYVIMYMYDRTADTPAGIYTPLDVHRAALASRP